MENRKSLRLLIFIIAFIVPVCAYGYGYETHGYLTQETVDFYLSRNGSVSGYLIPYLVDGARREDDSPRWLNHFYDPVYNRGFSYDERIDPTVNVGNYPSSKQWAQSSPEQNKAVYKVGSIIASILNSFQQKQLSLTTESDFTWNIALDYWASGDKEKAMFALGHVLHLIQDASVPDHTRNDAHHDGSPYESWTSKFVLGSSDAELKQRLQAKNTIAFSDLNPYFDIIASYSNNNFYSKDTIGIQTGYQNPQPEHIGLLGSFVCGVKRDEDGIEYRLFIKSKPTILTNVISDSGDVILLSNKEGGDVVLSDYWSRLSTKSVQYGAGVIDLFLQEANKREASYKSQLPWYERILQQVNNQANSFLGMVTQFGASTESGNASPSPTLTILVSPTPTIIVSPTPTRLIYLTPSPIVSLSPLQSPTPSPFVLGSQTIAPGNNGPLFTQTQPSPSLEPSLTPAPELSPIPEPTIEPTPTPTPTPTPEPSPSLTPTPEPSPSLTPTPAPSPTPQLIPKILDLRWGVDPESRTGYSVEFLYRDPALVDVGTEYYQGRYGLYFYLNRFQDYSYGFNPYLWREMFLAEVHQGDLVKFYYSICEWGDDSVRESFHVAATWITNYCSSDFWSYRWEYRANNLPHLINPDAGIWLQKLPIASAPKPLAELTGADYITASLYTSDYSEHWSNNFAQMDNRQWYFEGAYRNIMPTPSPTPTPTPEPTPLHTVVINEIAWMGTEAAAQDEWIELYNGTEDDIDLTDWQLHSQPGDIDILLTDAIGAGEYYLLERTDDTTISNITADLVYTGALNNTCENLELIDPDGNVVDKTGCNGNEWYAGSNETKASMERINWDGAGDSVSNWQANNGSVVNGLGADSNPIRGTPKSINSASIH